MVTVSKDVITKICILDFKWFTILVNFIPENLTVWLAGNFYNNNFAQFNNGRNGRVNKIPYYTTQ